MKRVLTLLLELTISLMWIFNFFAGIVGAIWLFFSGEGWLIVVGLIMSIAMPFVYTLASLPSLIFIPIFSKLEEKNLRFFMGVMAFIMTVYNNFLLSVWIATVIDVFLIQTHTPPIGLWLMGYSVVMGPISYMASKEGPDAGAGTTLGVLFTQVGYLLVSLIILFGGSSEVGYLWLWLLLLAFTAFTMWAGFVSLPKHKEIKNKTCPKCGEILGSIANFCKSCGYKFAT